MSKKRKPGTHLFSAGTADNLRPRIERAVAEGRFQQALDLAKQLYKHEPTAGNLELLKKTYLGRARQLRTSGYDRDAATTLEAAVRIDAANGAWLEQVAAELAACGAAHKALELVSQVPSSALAATVLVRAADTAVQQEGAGKAQLPPELHADFDRILAAFKQVEAGQDDAARETLQGIGLKSVFLDWKLLLRGLQAYYQNDDARALENWSRLDAERVPARLAAPFRCHVDPAFRDRQSPETQSSLQVQFQRLQGSAAAEHLRRLRPTLANTEAPSLANAFRQVEALLPTLRTEAPHLIPRLANCCYWAVLETGPDDILRYRRVFGTPPDDPNFNRLGALASERGDLAQAHQLWQDYAKDIAAAPPNVWPPHLAARARALIWLRMGENAGKLPSREELKNMPPHLRDMIDWPTSPKPAAPECFERCIQLAPDMLEPYQELVRHYQAVHRPDDVEKAGRRLLERFPDHVPTLTGLGHALHHEQKYTEALTLFQRALKANPLDRGLRASVSVAHTGCARLALEARRFDEARTHLQSALTFNDDPDDSQIRCRWASVEFKAGNPAAAEEQIGLARAHASADLPVAFRMLTECARLKLDKKVKARFDKEVKEGLAAPPTGAAAAGLVNCAAGLHLGDISYYGQKGHEKAIQTYAQKASRADFTERQLVTTVNGLMALDGWKPAERLAEIADRKFRNNPEFPVLLARIRMRPQGQRSPPIYRVLPLLDRAEKLIRDLPKEDERKERLMKEVSGMRQAGQLFRNPYGGFGGMFDSLFGDLDDDEFD